MGSLTSTFAFFAGVLLRAMLVVGSAAEASDSPAPAFRFVLTTGSSATPWSPPIALTEADGEYRIEQNVYGGVSVVIETPSEIELDWKLEFCGEGDAPLQQGRVYSHANDFHRQTNQNAGFSMSGPERISGGTFAVHAITYGTGTEILQFHATFIGGGIAGEIRFNAETSPGLPRKGIFQGREGQVVVSRTGAFSAQFRFDGHVVRRKGQFDPHGCWFEEPPPDAIYSVRLWITEAGVDAQIESLERSRSVYVNLARPWVPTELESISPAVGNYSFFTDPSFRRNSYLVPRGSCWGLVRVTKSGHARITGRLVNGEGISFGARLTHLGALKLFIPLPEIRGWLSGMVYFADEPWRATDAIGELVWQKPTPYRGHGFIGILRLVATRISQHNSAREILSGGSDPVTARLTLSNSLDAPLANPLLRLYPGNSVEVLNDPGQVSLKIGKNGIMRGSLHDPALGKKIPFSGVIQQERGLGAGFWIQRMKNGSYICGQVLLEAVTK